MKYNFRQDLEEQKTEQITVLGTFLIGLSQYIPELSCLSSSDIKYLYIHSWGFFHRTKINLFTESLPSSCDIHDIYLDTNLLELFS